MRGAHRRAVRARARRRLTYTERLSWLAADPATRRDLRWTAANLLACALAAAPAAIIATGLIEFIGPEFTRLIPPPAFPGNTSRTLVVLGLAVITSAGVLAAPALLRAYGLVARSILAPGGEAELELRVQQLTETRSEALDTGAAEIRRIERDLHDGAQARLVAMGMTLDAAGQIIDSNPEAAPPWCSRPGTPRSRRWPSCAPWSAASTRRCWPTAA